MLNAPTSALGPQRNDLAVVQLTTSSPRWGIQCVETKVIGLGTRGRSYRFPVDQGNISLCERAYRVVEEMERTGRGARALTGYPGGMEVPRLVVGVHVASPQVCHMVDAKCRSGGSSKPTWRGKTG